MWKSNLEPLLNTGLHYMDISDQISFDEDTIKARQCYIENGIVIITIEIKKGTTAGAHHGSLNVEYAPRCLTSGSFANVGTMDDAGAYISQVLYDNGDILLWFARDIKGFGYVTFVYPLRRS